MITSQSSNWKTLIRAGNSSGGVYYPYCRAPNELCGLIDDLHANRPQPARPASTFKLLCFPNALPLY